VIDAGAMILNDKASFESFIKQSRDDLSTAIHVLWNQRDEEVWARDPFYYTMCA
jgi:hypothetical protein